jgi:crotonobetainyl-CoA:carnitine CoA-transferase CaiB-like acyl-CoA transferase
MSGGLDGVRVVDFGHQIAGPLAALLLAEAGADVVHVDSPAAASAPGRADAYFNRGKRRITLDLKTSAGRSVARELVAGADVVIENFRPGVMERLGLGAPVLRAASERLIYCSLPGFAPDDASAAVAAWDGIVHAAVAGYRPLSQHWDPSGRKKATVTDRDAPLFTPITTASNFGGLMGAVGVVMALIARQHSGAGQLVQVPLAEAFAEAYSTMLGMRVYENGLMGDGQMLRDLTYTCADGGMIDLSPYAKFVIPLLTAAGVAGEWEAEGLIDTGARTFSLENRDRIMAAFADLVRSQPAAWWDDVATRAEVPVSRVRTPAQWMASEHAALSGAAVTLDDPLAGRIVLPGRSFDMSGPVPPPRPRHVPDQDRDALLAELTAARPQPAVPSGPASGGEAADLPLAGVKVIDISQAVAGPTAARLLADFGADVIKVGSTVPAVTDGIVGQLHRGKRTILVNGKSAAGERLTGDLLSQADALVTNFTLKSQARYGIDYERVRALNPRLVHCSITAYGQSGPWAHRRGYENQCNAATGMSWRYGSRFGWTLYQPTPINDASTGILGAFATAVALYARAAGGAGATGQRVAASLAQGSTLHQAAYLTIEAQSGADADAGDAVGSAGTAGPDDARSEYGMSALYRLYRAADAWFFLAARPGDLSALLAVTGLAAGEQPGDWHDPAGFAAGQLAVGFAAEPAGHWVTALAELGVAAHAVISIDGAVDYLAGRDLVYFERGPDGRDVARPGIGRWLSDTPPHVGASPGAIGSQVVEVLAELGISGDAVRELAGARVVCLPDQLPRLTRLT